jgi:hypothetical protein
MLSIVWGVAVRIDLVPFVLVVRLYFSCEPKFWLTLFLQLLTVQHVYSQRISFGSGVVEQLLIVVAAVMHEQVGMMMVQPLMMLSSL